MFASIALRSSGALSMPMNNKPSAPGKPGRTQLGATPSVETEIASLQGRGIGELRDYWARRFRKAPPPIQSADVLHRLIAWKLQAELYGDLNVETRQTLSRLARAGHSPGHQSATGNPLRPGSVLLREWKGMSHRVLVLDGTFEYNGTRYKSLTQVARHITGTRWSGPRFFGVDQAAGPSARAVAKTGRSK